MTESDPLSKVIALQLARDMARVAKNRKTIRSLEAERAQLSLDRQEVLSDLGDAISLKQVELYESWIAERKAQLTNELMSQAELLTASKESLSQSFGKSLSYECFQKKRRKEELEKEQSRKEREGGVRDR